MTRVLKREYSCGLFGDMSSREVDMYVPTQVFHIFFQKVLCFSLKKLNQSAYESKGEKEGKSEKKINFQGFNRNFYIKKYNLMEEENGSQLSVNLRGLE